MICNPDISVYPVWTLASWGGVVAQLEDGILRGGAETRELGGEGSPQASQENMKNCSIRCA